MYPFINNPFQFGPINPWFNRRRPNYPTLDRVIPKIVTTSISETNYHVSLGICPKTWCSLPNEGVMVFEVRHTPDTASASYPVAVSTSGSVSSAATNGKLPLVKADSSPLIGSEISAGNRYFIYYNKCDNVMQVMNHYPVTPTPSANADANDEPNANEAA